MKAIGSYILFSLLTSLVLFLCAVITGLLNAPSFTSAIWAIAVGFFVEFIRRRFKDRERLRRETKLVTQPTVSEKDPPM